MSRAKYKSVRLHYGDITLVPTNKSDSWHLPGQRVATTEQLVELANSRDIIVQLTESSSDGQTRIRLN